MARIGLFGGSFNPVHVAHLILVERAREEYRLDKVLFIPVGTPPHKPNPELAPAGHRVKMLKLAIAGNPCFEVSTLEVDSKEVSYTLLTVRKLRKALGRDNELFLIVGADSIRDMPTWWHARELAGEVQVIGLRRPGVTARSLKKLESFFGKRIAGRLTSRFVDAPLLEVSSTDIRERVRLGRSIRYLVPEPVRAYIVRQGLYSGGKP
jgi:nicotinate-nucleotide adenylyltransferase